MLNKCWIKEKTNAFKYCFNLARATWSSETHSVTSAIKKWLEITREKHCVCAHTTKTHDYQVLWLYLGHSTNLLLCLLSLIMTLCFPHGVFFFLLQSKSKLFPRFCPQAFSTLPVLHPWPPKLSFTPPTWTITPMHVIWSTPCSPLSTALIYQTLGLPAVFISLDALKVKQIQHV